MFNGIYYTLYIIFGNNLLIQGPVQIAVFLAYFSVSQKRNIKRSPNGMKPSGELFLEPYLPRRLGVHARERERWPQGSRARPAGQARPHPRGPSLAPPMPSFLLYISMYPENTEAREKTLIPPPQPSVPVRSHLGACSGAPPEGDRSRSASTSTP